MDGARNRPHSAMHTADAFCCAVILLAEWNSSFCGKETKAVRTAAGSNFVTQQALQFCACIVILVEWK